MKKGKLIVFEGTDGSGKATQVKFLLDFLKTHRVACTDISFPRYKESLWGELVGRYLRGEFGKVGELDPRLVVALNAGDRLAVSGEIRRWMAEGRIVIANRYVFSNIAYGAANINGNSQKKKFIDWVYKLEYEENKIPKEDMVIFLYVPVDVSRKLIGNRRLDINEENLDYLRKVAELYQDAAKESPNWIKVDCVLDGEILSKEKIHEKVLKVLKDKKII